MLATDRTRRLFKEGGWIVVGQVLVVFGSLAGVRILTELLTPQSYGELALGMTIATLVNQTILGPLGGGITRFYAPALELGDLGGYLRAIKKLVMYVTALIILLTVITCLVLIIFGMNRWIAISVSALIFAVLNGYSAILSSIQTAARQRAIVALHQGGDLLLRSLVVAVLILCLGASSVLAIIGYAIAELLILLSQLYFFQRILIIKSYKDDDIINSALRNNILPS